MNEVSDKFNDPENPTPRHDWVFFHPRQQTSRVKDFKRAINFARKAVGLKWINDYTFRHYFVSKALMSGVSSIVIKEWIGHSTTVLIDQVYSHIRPEYKASEIGKINIPA